MTGPKPGPRPGCQHSLDTGRPLLCYYAADPQRRPHCTLTAERRFGTTLLCTSCAGQRSTLGKGQPAARLADRGPVNVLDWITSAHADTIQAHNDLAAAITRARTQGHTWTAIAAPLNITRQAAQQRFTQPNARQG